MLRDLMPRQRWPTKKRPEGYKQGPSSMGGVSLTHHQSYNIMLAPFQGSSHMDLPFRACRIKQAQKTGSSGKFLLNTESCTISSPRTKRRVQRIVLWLFKHWWCWV